MRSRAAASPGGRDGLKAALDRLYAEYNRADAVPDPIDIVRRYPERADREVVGFCASGLAFGRVASVLQSVERVLAVMGPSPAAFVRRFDPRHDGRAFEPLVHRWTRGDDLAALVLTLRRMMDEAGSIEAFFLLGHDASRTDVEASIESFSTPRAGAGARGGATAPDRRAVLLPAAVDRQRLQAPEPVSPVDGPARRGRLRRVVGRLSVAADRAARRARRPAGAVPGLDAATGARAGRWRPTSRRRFAGWTRPTRSATTSRCATSACATSAASTGRRRMPGARSAGGAGHGGVDGERRLHHPVDAERRSDAREPGLAPSAAVSDSSRSMPRMARRRARAPSRGGTSTPVSPSTTTSGMPPARVATIGRLAAIASSSDVPRPSVTELITNRSSPFSTASTSVRKPAKHDVLGEVQMLDLVLERRAKLALAEHEEARLRHVAHHDRGRVDQVLLSLVRHQRGDVADDQRVRREPVLLADVQRLDGGHAIDVDALVDRRGPLGGHAVLDEHRPDRVRGA